MTMGIIAQGIQDYPLYEDTNLAASATFTSDWRTHLFRPQSTDTEIPVTSPWAEFVKGIAFSNVSGTIHFDYSNDGGTTTHFNESFTVGAGLAGALAFNRRLYGTHWRIRYINDGTIQADFSLLAILRQS